MMSSTKAKESRIEIRVSQEDKKLLEQAASLQGLSLSQYMLSTALDIAKEKIATHEKMVLSNRDRDLFIALIDNPPAPCKALKSAVHRYNQKYGL
ncbi:MAG: DUF1778 domain-containing protein [Cyanothece sp. SIO1E1]|nr:DUF1778 domain-containing protein [Cyanothece sp. SIO1E1]